jgi:ryanodine receptor 2
MEKQKLLFHQARLSNRGVAEMVLLHISACKGVPSEMVMKTLQLGIAILRGGNIDIQMRMLNHLKDKKDVGFFTSIAGLMNSCSVLDLDAFERNTKAEGLGVGSEGAAGEKNMHDAEFTCALFRFIQLTCEGHNLEWQNYLRTQAGNTTTVNVVICTVDYLLRLQESIMDFYWHYSSKELIDPAGKINFFKAIGVASQVFNTLTEVIQGPCTQNQQALAHSRLWDAVGGFLFLFSHMQDKLSKHSSQVDLLKELLNLQKDMITMMLSMLEGNVVNGTIGKQMVDTLVESASNVELILKYFDMFLKLKDLTTSPSFLEVDPNNEGWVSPKDFKDKMEQQKSYTA